MGPFFLQFEGGHASHLQLKPLGSIQKNFALNKGQILHSGIEIMIKFNFKISEQRECFIFLKYNSYLCKNQSDKLEYVYLSLQD